jgi:gliding motility-associated-like protein
MKNRFIFLLFLMILGSNTILWGQCPATITSTPANATICADDTASFSILNPTELSYEWYKNGILIPDSTRSILRARDPGEYKVKHAGCGTFSNAITLVVNPSPSGTLTCSPTPPVCSGDPVTLTITTAPQNSFSWLNPIPIPPSTNPQTVAFTSSTTAMAVLINYSTNCTKLLLLPIQVNETINGGVITNDQQICSGVAPSLLTGGPASGGSGTYLYQWQHSTSGSASGFSDISSATDLNYQPPILTETTWYRRIAFSPPCSQGVTNSIEITVDPLPEVISGGTLDICSGNHAVFSPSSTTPGTTFTWTGVVTSPGVNVNGVTASGTGNIDDILALDPGGALDGEVTYTITPHGPDPTNCVGPTTTLVVTIHPVPVIQNPLLSQIICSGTAMAAVTWQSSVTSTTYSWYATAAPGVTVPQTSGIGNLPEQVITSNLMATTYVTFHVFATGPAPTYCAANETLYIVQVEPSPTVTNTPLFQEVCSDEETTLVTLTSNVPGTMFTWTATGNPSSLTGFTSSGTAAIPVEIITNPTTSPGTVTYHIIPSGAAGSCGATPRDYITTVHPTPTINSPLAGSTCSNSPFTYNITSLVAGATFTWSRDAVSGILNAPASGIGNTFSETLINTTTNSIDVIYVLTPTGPANTSCTGISSNLIVTVKPQPLVDAGPDQTIFNGTSTSLNGSATAGTGSITSISWTPVASISGPANIFTPQTVPLSTTTSFSLTVTDGGGCSNTDNIQVIVTGSGLSVNPTASPESICIGSVTHLHANPSGGSQTYSYSWTSNPSGFTSESANPDADPIVTTTYTVSVYDGFSTVTGSITVNVNPLPQQYIVQGGGDYCAGSLGLPVHLSGSQLNVQYKLFRGASTLVTELSGTGAQLNFGNQTIPGYYTVTGVNPSTGCTQEMSGSVAIVINQNPISDAGTDQTIAHGISTQLTGNAIGGTSPYTYSWSPVSSIVPGESTLTNPHTTNLYSNTEFILTVSDYNNCTGSENVWVNVDGNPLGGTILASPESICNNGSTVNLIAYGTGGSGIYTYSWTSIPIGFNSSLQNPIVDPTITTQYFVSISDGYNSVDLNTTVTVNPLPGQFAVTGGGTYCYGGTGKEVGLSGSETGITYQLFRNLSPMLPTVEGNGSSISFGHQTGEFTYTVLATNPNTSCAENMIGEAAVTILPLPNAYYVTGGGSYAYGGPGVEIGTSGSETGVNYRLILLPDTITPSPGLPGTGLSLSFGNQTLAGTYIVSASSSSSNCTNEQLGSATITINMTPTPFNLFGGGDLCYGSPGLTLYLDGSELGIQYIMFRDGDSIDIVSGTGDPLAFGPYVTPGIYAVEGINITNHAAAMMNNNDTIALHPLPLGYMIVPQGDTCPGTEILINGSENNMQYKLLRGTDTIMSITGTGTIGYLSFGMYHDTGTYRIIARNPVSGCQNLMNGSVTIHGSPIAYDIGPIGIQCPTTNITLSNSQPGILYQLRRDSLINIDVPHLGTGGMLDFGSQTIPGTYRIIATNSLTNCYAWMNGAVEIHQSPSIFTIIPNTDTCAGALVRLNGSQTGMRYRLMLNGTVLLSALNGTGQDLIFGTYTTSGTYTIIGYDTISLCEAIMTGHLTIYNSPTQYNVLPNGVVCEGSAVGLDNSEVGVTYTLIRDGWIVVGTPVFGTGSPITFGPQYFPGYYTIHGYWNSTGCEAAMIGTASLDAKPLQFLMQPTGMQCPGIDITLNGSESFVNYQLLRDNVPVHSLPGTGGVLNFGQFFLTGEYTISAIKTASTCDTMMTGQITIQSNPLIFNITPLGDNCPPTNIGLDGSQIGVTYQLYKNNLSHDPPIDGTGSYLNFNSQTNGTYFIIATNSLSSCNDTMSGIAIVSPGPFVSAGSDSTFCETNSFQLYGIASAVSATSWTTTGDGTFINPDSLNAIYTPGPLDKVNGEVDLVLSGTGVNPCPNTIMQDTLRLNIQPSPVVDAGDSDSICINQNYQLFATATYYSTVAWTSSGDGIFSNRYILNPVYFPGINDKLTETVTLTLRVAGSPFCALDTVSDALSLTLEPLPGAFAGNDTSICENQSLQVVGVSTDASAVQWITTGDGTFADPLSNITQYTPGEGDKQAGLVKLIFKAFGKYNCSQEFKFDTLTLVIHHTPIVNAGPDTSICENQILYLFGSAGNVSSIFWTTSGEGTFGHTGDLNTTYTPGIEDKLMGYADLVLHATGSGACTLVTMTDTLRLTLHHLPTVFAGSDSTSCPNCAIPLHGTTSAFSSVQWNSLTDGTFSNPNVIRPNYIPGPLAIAQGFADLQFTAHGTAACLLQQVSDTTRITFHPIPVASITGSTIVCEGDTATFIFNFTGDQPFTVHYSIDEVIDSITNIYANSYTLLMTPDSNVTCLLISIRDQNCTGNLIDSMHTITVNPLPTSYSMTSTSGGSYCAGDSGVIIGVSGSQIGAFYQLLKDGTEVGYLYPGTGSEFIFPWYVTEQGVYKVSAFFASTQCFSSFADSVILMVFPIPDVGFTYQSPCLGTPTAFFLEGIDIPTVTDWYWDFGDGDSAHYESPIGPSHVYNLVDDYVVTMRAVDSNGCVKVVSHLVSVSPNPHVLFSSTTPACENDTIYFTDHSYISGNAILTQWHWEFGDGLDTIINSSGNPNVSHSYIGSGAFAVHLTVTTSSQCIADTTESIVIKPVPFADFIHSNACQSSAIQFTDLSQSAGSGAISQWNWDFGDPSSGNNNHSYQKNPIHQFQSPGIYTVSLVIMSENGCYGTINKQVIVSMAPAAIFQADSTCLGASTQFTDLSIAHSDSLISWDWDFGDGWPHSTLQNPLHTYVLAGTYYVTLTVTNSNFCSQDTTIAVVVISKPYVDYSSSAPQCTASAVDFTNLSQSSSGEIVRWRWDFGDGTIITVNHPDNPDTNHIFANSALQHVVRLTAYTSDSCSSFKEYMINSFAKPIPNFAFSTPNCLSENVNFFDQTQLNGGSEISGWNWNFDDPGSGDQNTSALQNPLHLFSVSGTHNVQLIVTNLNGCSDTILKTISINALPESNFLADTNCVGTLTQFTDLSIPNGGVIDSWLWNFGDGTPNNYQQNPQHLFAAPGNYTVNLTVTNSNSCYHTTSKTVIIHPIPSAAFGFSVNNCARTPVPFNDFSSIGQGTIVKWHWQWGDGSSTTIIYPNNPDTSHLYTTGGNYQVVLTVTTSDSCSASIAQSVNVMDTPQTNFSFSTNNCQSFPVAFQDLTQENGGGSIVSWVWDFGDPNSGSNNSSTFQNPDHTFDTAGLYSVYLVATNISGCQDTMNKPILIHSHPTVDFTFDSACLGQPTHFTDQSIPNSGAIISWLWNFGDGNTSSLQNPEHTYLNAGIFQVSLTVHNSNNCSWDSAAQVIVNPQPIAAFSYSNNCANSMMQFVDNSTPSGYIQSWFWDFGDGGSSILQNPTHLYTTAGIYTVSLLVTDNSGCTNNVFSSVTIQNQPVGAFSFVSKFCPAGEVSFMDSSYAINATLTSWYWQFEPGSFSTNPNPVHTFSLTNSLFPVSLIVSDNHGCSDTIIHDVFVKPAFNFTFINDTVCAGETTSFEAINLANGDSLHDLHWNFGEPSSGANNTSTLPDPSHAYLTPGVFLTYLRAANSDNCIDSVFKNIIVYELPSLDFSYDTTSHCDTMILFRNLSNGNGSPIHSMTWHFGDGDSLVFIDSIPETVQHGYHSFNTYNVTINGSNDNGCKSSITKPVLIACVKADFSPADTSFCSEENIVFTDGSSPGSLINKWVWDFGDGTDTTYTMPKPYISHNYLNAGEYSISLSVEALYGNVTLSDTLFDTVTVKQSARAGFSVTQVCLGDTSRYMNTTDTNGIRVASYEWTFGDPDTLKPDTSSMKNPQHLFGYHGKFNSQLIVRNVLGCNDTVIVPSIIHGLPIADFSNSRPCTRYETTFTDQTLPADTAISSWVWYLNDPLFADDSLQGKTIRYTFIDSAAYHVTLKVKDKYGCVDTVNKTVTTFISPYGSFSVIPDPAGKAGSIVLENTTESASAFSWFFGDGTGSNLMNPEHLYNDDGTFTIKLIAKSVNGCSDTVTKEYTFYFDNLYVPNAFAPTNENLEVRYFKPVGMNLRNYLVQVFDKIGHLLWESTALDEEGRPSEGWDGKYKGELLPSDTYFWKISASFRDGPEWRGSNIGVGEPSTMGTVTLIR